MNSRLLRTLAFVALAGMVFAASCGNLLSSGEDAVPAVMQK